VWIIGWGGLVLRYDGETIEKIPCESEGVLYNIWQDAQGTIRVSEVNGVLGFDGTGFAFQHQDQERLFVGGFVDAEGRNLILDESPSPLVERPEGDLAPLLPVSVVDFTDVIETGDGLVTSGAEASGWLHDGASWTSLGVEAVFDEDERPTLRSVTEAVDGTLFFVGDDGAAVSGTSGAFVREETGTDLALRSVCASASGSVWAVGEAGIALEHLPSGEWLEVSGPWTGDLNAVHCADDGSIYVGGDTGVFVSSGSGFEAVDHSFASSVLAFAAIDDEIWALGRLGLVAIESADGSWNELPPPTFEALHGAVRQGDDVVVVGRAGTALRYRGGVFTKETTGMRTNLNAVLALDGTVLAVGDSGVVLTTEP